MLSIKAIRPFSLFSISAIIFSCLATNSWRRASATCCDSSRSWWPFRRSAARDSMPVRLPELPDHVLHVHVANIASYSQRNAIAGSTRVARRAGTNAANAATLSSTSGVTA
jgi:hypothetical protein